jgi:hypothetical protein
MSVLTVEAAPLATRGSYSIAQFLNLRYHAPMTIVTIVIDAQSALAPIAVGLRRTLNGVFFSANMAPDIFWILISRANH